MLISPRSLVNLGLPTMVSLVGIFVVGNYLFVSVARGIFRWQIINRYHYDYYDAQPLNRTGQFLHCLQLEAFRWPTVLITIGVCGIELSGIYFLLLS